MLYPMPRTRVRAVIAVWLAAAAGACDDGQKAEQAAKIDALEARVAELERRTTDTSKAMEPLAALPNTVEQAQQSMKTIKDEQATLVARLARAEETIAALQAGKPIAGATVEAPEALVGTTAKSLAIGVTECDEFMSKYAACIDKMPEAARKSMLDALQQMSESWKDVATGPGRSALASACKTADESSKKAFESMGCTW